MLPNEEKSDRLDDLERRLYSPDEHRMPKKKVGILHPVRHAVQDQWNAAKEVPKTAADFTARSPIFKKFFIASAIFFVIALGIGAYSFFGNTGSVSIDNVVVDVIGSTFAAGGEALPLEIEVGNKNSVQMEYTDLIIEYPRGSDANNAGDMVREHISLGTIDSGAVAHERATVTLYGQQGSTRDIKLSVQFRVAGSNAVFQKIRTYGVTINSAPAVLAVDGVKSISPDQEMTLAVTVTPNANKSVSNLLVRVDYPTGFEFKSASPAPDHLSNVWYIAELKPGEPIEIKVTGVVHGEDGEERSLRVYTGLASEKDRDTIGVVLASTIHTVAIEKPFLEANLAINGFADKDTVVIAPQTKVEAEIRWANNLPTRIINAEITAKITGAVVNKSSLTAGDGLYDSVGNTITWNKSTTPALTSLNPGQLGVFKFSFDTNSLIKPDRTLVGDPTITIQISAKGEQTTGDSGVLDVQSFEKKSIKFSGNFQVAGEVFRSVGPFTNTGPFPPKADEKTTYTVRWTLATSTSPIANVVVRAAMPAYVHFLGAVSPSGENLALDPVTGEIVWKVGTVPKGTGLLGSPKTVYFQIELVPSLTQVGTTPILLRDIKATGDDTVVGMSTSSVGKALDTKLSNDPAYLPGYEQVVK